MTYAEARREARKLYGNRAELRLMQDAPALKYQLGIRVNGILLLAGAGNSWAEAMTDARARLNQALSTKPGGENT